MENKQINVTLKKVNEKDSLVFKVSDTKEVIIDLNSDDQTKLKELFYILVQDLMENTISLKLAIEDGYDVKIFTEIATEYVDALNAEIKSVKANLPTKE